MKLTNAVFSLLAAAALSLPVTPVFAQGGDGAKPAETKPPAEAEKPKSDDTKTDKPAKEEAKLVYVNMKTSMGNIVIELNNEKAPISVKNFLSYLDKGHYDGTIFHRVIRDFMIQGGGFGTDLKQKDTDKQIKNEWKNGLKNIRGSIAMARTSTPDSATSQFFINVKDNTALDDPSPHYGGAAYAVFGRVVSGMSVVDEIRAVATGDKVFAGGSPMADVPKQTVTIEKVTRLTEEEATKAKEAAKEADKKK